MKNKISDLNIVNYNRIASPDEIMNDCPLSLKSKKVIMESRKTIENLFEGKDLRVLLISGPCSIHNFDEAIDYAKRLKKLSDSVSDRFFVVMRTYFEKPRTVVGWEGMVYDPKMNGSFDVEGGIRISRKILQEITSLGLPVATEFVNPMIPQYISDFISFGTIGARTCESPTHRHMASGLSMPIGFKNTTSGDVDVAINAIKSSRYPHSFLGIDKQGAISVVNTFGNKYSNLILRGGNSGPNYHKETVEEIQKKLGENSLSKKIIIDCSHGNSEKDYKNQKRVFTNVLNQRRNNKDIIGVMLESNIYDGCQKINDDLRYGISVTDSCIGWENTEEMIMQEYENEWI